MPGAMMGGPSPMSMYPMMYSSQQITQRVVPQPVEIPQEEVPVFSQPEEEKVEQVVISETHPVEVEHVEDNTLQEPVTQAELDAGIWNEIDDEDDEPDHDQDHDDDNDNKSQEEHPAESAPQVLEEGKQAIDEHLEEPAPEQDGQGVEHEGEHGYKPRGSYRGHRGGRYGRGHHYERYDNEEYRGRPYNRGPRRTQRYRQHRGDRGGRGGRGGYEKDYQGYNRGYGGYDKGGDNGQYWSQNKKQQYEKPQEKIDDDGFFIVKK
jgi:hypothetical protein